MWVRTRSRVQNIFRTSQPGIGALPMLLSLVGVLLSLLLFYGPTDNWSWDPSYYYAQLRSPIIDGDLDLRGETVPADLPAQTITGLLPSQWPVGPGILWAPFFALAHLYTLVVDSASATGSTPIYVALVSAGSALYGFLGVFVIYRLCRLFADHGASLLTAILVLLSTPLFFYVYRQPIMAHSSSLLAAALLVYAIVLVTQGKLALGQSGLVLGVLVGLNTLLRWVGAGTALLVAMLYISLAVDALRQRDWQSLRAIMIQSAIAALMTLLIMLPQMAFWYHLHLAWIVRPISGFASGYAPIHLIDLFVHSNRGILVWAPFILISLPGLFRLPFPRLQVIFWPYLLAYLYVLSSWESWHGGGGFGPRFFIELLPIVAIGFALLADMIWRFYWGRALLLLLAPVLLFHHLALVTMVEQSWLPLQAYLTGEPISLSYHWQAITRLVSDPALFFQPRLAVAPDRQTIVVNYLTGNHGVQAYLMPLVALAVVPTGILLYRRIACSSYLPAFALALCLYMLIWASFLLLL